MNKLNYSHKEPHRRSTRIEQIEQLLNESYNSTEIADLLGIHPGRVRAYMKSYGVRSK